MAKDTRKKDVSWNIVNDNGDCTTWDQVQVAVLMDLRDELKAMNRILSTSLGCYNFMRIPGVLDDIERNTNRVTQKRLAAQRRKAAERKAATHV